MVIIMANITYRIEEGKVCGCPKEKWYHIFVEGEGITMWNRPYLNKMKFNPAQQRYEIWTKQPKEQVLEEFIAVYGEDFEKLVKN